MRERRRARVDPVLPPVVAKRRFTVRGLGAARVGLIVGPGGSALLI